MNFREILEHSTEVIINLYSCCLENNKIGFWEMCIYNLCVVLYSGTQLLVNSGFRGLWAVWSFFGCDSRFSRWVVVVYLTFD